ncbi:MAG: RNA polymerase sigma factor [Chloroflexi bacterium]|nr:MAG: RNA polymerase sigma factor [Chloroflexota bacterium]
MIATTSNDNLLLERISQGDMASFETLFHTHYDRVYGLVYRLVGNRAEAEDVTQEVFLKLYHQAFTKRRFAKQQTHNVSAWLYRVATNMAYNAIRSRKRRWQRNTVLVIDPIERKSVSEEVEKREEETAVRAALARLKPRQAQLLILRQMGFSYAECATACDIAPGSVGTLLARAAKAFAKAYQQELAQKHQSARYAQNQHPESRELEEKK